MNPRQAPLAGKVGSLEDLTQLQTVAPNRVKIGRKDKAVSFCFKLGRFRKFQAAGQRSAKMAISRTSETARRAVRAVAAYGTGGAWPEAKRRVSRRASAEGGQAHGLCSARRSGEGGDTDALAAEPTMAGASGAAGEVFGFSDRPTKELLEISDAL